MTPAGGRLRVVMHAPQFHPLVGGYERAAERVAAELVRRGHVVQVVAERRSRAWPAEEVRGGVPVRRLPCVYRRGVHTATAMASLAAWLVSHRGRFDILHAHQYGSTPAVGLALARRMRWRTVLKLTSGAVVSALSGRSPLARAALAAHRGVDACLAMSVETRDAARALGIPEERIHTVPNGIDTAAFHPSSTEERAALRRVLGIEDGGPLALYVGRLSAEKGPAVLLEAWERVARDIPDARLAVVGDGPQLESLRGRLAASPSAGSVRFVGRVEDPIPWYRAADVFVLPSLREGLSNSLVEALACGLPVVSTRVSGSVDAFAAADLGELADPGDTEGLGAGLSRLLSLPERRLACGAAARELALRDYALERVVDRLERIYAG